jgi:hypothetical protein
LGPLFIALMLNSIFRHKKFRINVQRENLREKYFLLLWLFIPIVISFIASQFLTSIYYTRFTIPCSLAFYLLVAKGLFNVDKGKLRVVIGGIVIIFSLISIWGIHSNLEHEQWREVAEFIEDNGRDSDLVLISAWYCHIPFDYYFNETGLVSRDVFPKWDMSVDEKNINTLTAAVQGYERVWIVLSHNGDPHGLITKTLGNLLYEPSLKKDLIGIELYLFEKI